MDYKIRIFIIKKERIELLMKKILGMLLATSMLTASCLGSVAFAAPNGGFTDISDEKYAWAKPYIEEMATEGYINGYEDNTYRPDNNVSRLETIVLFARAMGALKDENAATLELAKEIYGDMVDDLALNFGQDEVSYMLYRGVLDEADLDVFLRGKRASAAMPRQEAAAIITKAMCAQEVAEAEVLVDMDYTDAKDISSDYAQYVFYVSEKGIMNGMDGGAFDPEGNVLRSQIAAMLKRAVDKMNYAYETVLVTDIDTNKNNITIDVDGEEVVMGYTDYTKFFDTEGTIDEEEMPANTESMITYINNQVAFVDALQMYTSEMIKGIYQGSVTNSNETIITIKNAETNEVEEYVASGKIQYYNENDNTCTLRDFKSGAYVEIAFANGKILEMVNLKVESYLTGAVIESVGIDGEMYIIISHDDEMYDGKKYILDENVAVYKNGDFENLSKLYKGDRIEIGFEYDKVVKIKAISNTKTIEGTIAEVVISSTPVLKIKTNGEVQEFDILPTAKVKIDGKEGTVYDLRVNDSVKITTESGAVLSIETTAAAISTNPVTGVIETVNTSKGFIIIDGQTIFCSDSQTTVITSNGSDKQMKDLKADMAVSVRGSLLNGAYIAKLIIIED